jgi:hypothetical protein
MSTHSAITPEEAADRLAIRELVDSYSRFADRRQPEKQAALYAEDGKTLVYNADPASSEPVQELTGYAEHLDGFQVLNQYQATTHFNGQSTITLDGDRATGESYCLAHHLSTTDGARTLLVMAIRYHDTFTKKDGSWYFAERQLIVDWTDSRPSQP